MRIFNILADCCQEQPLYINPFIEILKNCSKPFLLDKSTDAEIYSSALVAFYSDFGRKYFIEISSVFFLQRKIFLFRISSSYTKSTYSTVYS
jgi:hypothetical protein